MSTDNECAICYEKAMLPITLPDCKHLFCYLCIKGVVENVYDGSIDSEDSFEGPRCPVCRGPVDEGAIEYAQMSPSKLDMNLSTISIHGDEKDSAAEGVTPEPRAYWLYQSPGNSWWRFEPRSEKELEEGFKAGKESLRMVICGIMYRVDLKQMTQGKEVGGPRRGIKRALEDEFKTLNVKGIAGVRANNGPPLQQIAPNPLAPLHILPNLAVPQYFALPPRVPQPIAQNPALPLQPINATVFLPPQQMASTPTLPQQILPNLADPQKVLQTAIVPQQMVLAPAVPQPIAQNTALPTQQINTAVLPPQQITSSIAIPPQ